MKYQFQWKTKDGSRIVKEEGSAVFGEEFDEFVRNCLKKYPPPEGTSWVVPSEKDPFFL